MSLENTLRELLNEMIVPPYKAPLNPTVSTSGKPSKPSPVAGAAMKFTSHLARLLSRSPGPPKSKPKEIPSSRVPRWGENPASSGRFSAAAMRVQEGVFKRLKGLDGETVTLLGAMAAGAGVAGALKVHQNALDRLDQAHVAQQDAHRRTTDAYHKLQQTADVNRKANAPAMAPGMEKTVTPKPRRRLEETLVEHYKQRLEEVRVNPMLRAMRSAAAEVKKREMTKRIAAERGAEEARQAGMTDAERRAEHVERLRARDKANFAASLAVNTAVHQQRSGGGPVK